MKKVAIYTRKSKYTNKGDSIQNQIQICKEYLLKNKEDLEFFIYEDEGFSGKNTDRPQFQKMLTDAKLKKFSFLICYRLDRISRNIADFAALIQKLEKYDIHFISVNEQFDTSTPMGRAMMYIASVFAQLERETIADRIKDNMLELAKSGRWLGGRTPTGYRCSSTTLIDADLKERKLSILVPVEDELSLVKLLFEKYLELKSLSAVTKYLLSNHIKTKLLTDWDYAKVKGILSNPTYVKATEETIQYIKSQGISVVGSPDGIHGILSYNKKKSKTGPYKHTSEWIYSIGLHEGCISSEDWIKTQQLLQENKSKAPMLSHSHTALLTGILYCGKCGGSMRITYGSRNKKSGKRNYYYTCSLKHKSGGTRCNNSNVRGDWIEDLLIKELNFISIDRNILVEKLQFKKNALEVHPFINKIPSVDIAEVIARNTASIHNLLNHLALVKDSNVSKMLIKKIEILQLENTNLEKKQAEAQQVDDDKKETEKSLHTLLSSINDLNSFIMMCNIEEKKLLLAAIVSKAYWNGDTNELLLNLYSDS